MGNIDQRGFVDQPRASGARRAAAYLSGAEAAALLGIKRETLYAYASRGLLRSEPSGHGRERRYRRADLERLKARSDARTGHGPVAAGALRWGEPVLESSLTAIGAGGPLYRGHAATTLAESRSFEAVAELLWSGSLPDEPPAWRAANLGVRAGPLRALLPPGTHPLATLALAVPALGAVDPGRLDAANVGKQGPHPTVSAAELRPAELARARVLIVRMAALLGFPVDPGRVRAALAGGGGVARTLLVGLGAHPSARAERAVNQALVLLADHELNASTFAVRIAASAKADLYACVSAGLATASGPRHGGASDRVEALVAQAGSPAGARAEVLGRTRRGEAVPGFGHVLYPEGDPRAPPLLRAAVELAPQGGPLRTLLALLEAMRAQGGDPPTVDCGLVALTLALGLPPGSAAAIFAVGRAAGWVAHVFEQREEGFLLRPRARYVGPAAVGG
jgi:citrate synthase